MIRQVILSVGLAFMPLACSDDQQQAEEAVQMPDDGMDSEMGMGMPDTPSADSIQDAAASAAGMVSGNGETGYVRTAVLRVRSGPGTSHGTVRYILFNQQVNILEKTNHWAKIADGEYVSHKYLSNQQNQKQLILSD